MESGGGEVMEGLFHILRSGPKVPTPGETEMSLVHKVNLHSDSREILVISE